MRRRVRADDWDAATHLRRYRREEWGDDDQAPVRYWAAVAAWHEANPGAELDIDWPAAPDGLFDPSQV